jgi:hypothetical protein
LHIIGALWRGNHAFTGEPAFEDRSGQPDLAPERLVHGIDSDAGVSRYGRHCRRGVSVGQEQRSGDVEGRVPAAVGLSLTAA